MFETMPGTGIWPFGPLMMLAMVAAIVLPFWFIFSKAGYSKWLSLLMVVPLVNVILLYFLALSKWPSLGNK
jgi:hypothetical protein